MPGQPMVIGPFIRGLNNISTAGESEDTEVVELINMEVSLDRSLESRPPITLIPGTTAAVTNSYKIYGIYSISEIEWYLIVFRPTADGGFLEAVRNGNPADTVVIDTLTTGSLNNIPADMVQFKDACFFIMPPEATVKGFSWSISTPKTDIENMPKGNILISWKNRLWAAGDPASAANGDRVWFSSVDAEGLHPDKWEATNFFDTAPGEGGAVTAMVPFFNNLMIFKNDGTWRFSYSSAPAGGLVEKISGTVGAANKDCVVEFENVIYCFDQGEVYELMNSSFNPINTKLKFRPDAGSDFAVTPETTLSVVGRKLVVRYRNTLFVYNAETKTWSQWRTSRGLPFKFFELPGDSSSALSPTYVAAQNAKSYVSQPIDLSTAVPRFESGGYSGTIIQTDSDLSISGIDQIQSVVITPDTFITVGPGQEITVNANYESHGIKSLRVRYTFYSITGAETDQNVIIDTASGSGPVSSAVKAPDTAVYCAIKLVPTPEDTTDNTLRVFNLMVNKNSGDARQGLMSLTYETSTSGVPQEIIDSSVTTKVYDFGQPSVFKRLFLWGVDVKTFNRVIASTKVSSKRRVLTFGDIAGKPHSELATGTWISPLKMEGASNQIVDITEPIAEETETNRFFIKLIKGLRFRQVSFNVKMTTDGTVNTGPAKLYTITPYVSAKQMVVDKVS